MRGVTATLRTVVSGDVGWINANSAGSAFCDYNGGRTNVRSTTIIGARDRRLTHQDKVARSGVVRGDGGEGQRRLFAEVAVVGAKQRNKHRHHALCEREFQNSFQKTEKKHSKIEPEMTSFLKNICDGCRSDDSGVDAMRGPGAMSCRKNARVKKKPIKMTKRTSKVTRKARTAAVATASDEAD